MKGILQLRTVNSHLLPFWSVFCLLFYLGFEANSQSIKISLGPNQIGSNEVFTITLTATNQALDEYSNFPTIDGFSKAGTSSSSSMKSINGSVSNETSIIQNYMPTREGSFKLPPFSMKVNGKELRSPGTTIKVGPPVEHKNADPFAIDPFAYDPFEDFFGNRRGDLKDEKADAFLNLQADKNEVWAGEGVNLILSFLVAEDNRAELDFYDLGNQLAEMVKKLKPDNCWEENFGIEEITPRKVTIGKKPYTEYRIYQSTIYPLTAKSFTIPALTLKMLNYKTAGSATFFGAPKKQEIKGFTSKPVPIVVKELPPHPAKGQVAVGSFTLQESSVPAEVGIQKGVPIELGIKGEGNISYIPEPHIEKSEFVDLYPPNTRQSVQRAAGRVTGEKVFSYLLVPKELGPFELKKVFSWIYFNTVKGRYDTLQPKGQFTAVEGKKETAKSAGVLSQNSFYSLIDEASQKEFSENISKPDWLFWINISMGIMVVTTVWLGLLKKKGG